LRQRGKQILLQILLHDSCEKNYRNDLTSIRLMDVIHFSRSFIVFTLTRCKQSAFARHTHVWQLPDIYETIRRDKRREINSLVCLSSLIK